MTPNIEKHNYDGQAVEFEITTGKNLMVNATEMARIFDKQVVAFTRNDDTKAFISEVLKSENSHFLGIESEADLITSKQRSGTWMHRVLALKFAAWLSPAFELWVYSTIDHILFGHYRHMEESLKESALRRTEIETIKNQLRETDAFRKLEQLELEEKQEAYRRSKQNRMQLSLFVDQSKALAQV